MAGQSLGRRPSIVAPLAVGAICLALGALAGAPGSAGSKERRGEPAPSPNIVLIQSDDQTLAQFKARVMPRTTRLLADRGTTFSQYIVTTSQCCPSRASLLTGQYGHNNGVLSNQAGYLALGEKDNVLPVWLQQAGYRTIHLGKFLAGYERTADPAAPAPGWDRWLTLLGGTRYYDYDYYVDGSVAHHGHRPGDHVTHVLNRDAARLAGDYARADKPFYLQLDERSPHGARGADPYGRCNHTSTPLPRDEETFRKVGLPRPPSLDESDIADKPSYLSARPQLGDDGLRHDRKHWRCALRSLRGVDRGVGQIFRAIKDAGELERTVFIFTSDNGQFYGEHRLANGKVLPYEEALHLPLVMKVPPAYRSAAPARRAVADPVANIDLAPTILELAGAQPCPATGSRGGSGSGCRTMDGRSLLPLVDGSAAWADRGLLTEYSFLNEGGRYATCRFRGLRTPALLYAEHQWLIDPATGQCVPTDERELYDLTLDPYELDNRCYGGLPESCPAEVGTGLEARVAALADCAGIEGRDARVDKRPFCE